MRRWAWRDMVAPNTKSIPDVPRLRAREQELARQTTPFALQLRALITRRGDEQVRVSAYNLHAWLEILSEDKNESGAATVYFLVSRGFEVLPRGTIHPRQTTKNYQSAFDHADEMDVEIQRLLRAGFLKRYELAAREAGYPEQPPVCILACGMVVKITEAGIKHRLVCDGSAPRNGESLNDTMVVPPCRLSSVEQAAATLGKHSWVFTIDESDAYMQTPCSAWSVRYLVISWRGVLYGFTVMNFGLSAACSAQQSIVVALHRALRRRLLRGGLHCNPTSGYDQRQVALPPINEQRQKSARLATKMFTNKNRHLLRNNPALRQAPQSTVLAAKSLETTATPNSNEVSAAHDELNRLVSKEKRAGRRIDTCSGLQQYLDDLWHATSSRRAGYWVLLQALSLCLELRIRVNMKPGKTTCPSQQFKFLGINGCTRAFTLFLDADRVRQVLKLITEALVAGGATVADLASLIGLLVFCSAVVEARPYYRSLLSTLTNNCYDQHGHWARARKNNFVNFSTAELRDLRAWAVVLQHYNGTDIARGIRRRVAPFELFSDASGSGLAFSYAGHFEVQELPAAWATFVFARKDAHVRILQARLEGWASLLGLRYAIPRCSGVGATLRVRSDSSCFVGQARKMSSSDEAVQPILREIMWLAAVHGVRLQWDHVSAKAKQIQFVDALSRRTEADPAGKRAAIMQAGIVKAHTERIQSSKMGVHHLGPLDRPDLQPFLAAERCQALNFDTTWTAQRRDALDGLLRELSPTQPLSRNGR